MNKNTLKPSFLAMTLKGLKILSNLNVLKKDKFILEKIREIPYIY